MTAKGRRRNARTAAALGAVAGVLALSGCGIRTTTPVDAGAAPSRVPCEVSEGPITPQAQQEGVPVRVYLVCASQLEPVERTARITEERAVDDRIEFAQALLDELQEEPSSSEQEAGLATFLRGPLVVGAGRKGDPAGTLRLSRQPEDLPSAALAQIVCTLAENSAAVRDDAVVLAGPGNYAPRAYVCTVGTKERPEGTVPTVGPLPEPSKS
ncbi:hypothetical protein OHS70_13730 [Streptomyces sp. NBC_00390]|uniref:hypothetical protein n=1 Tax=Streptomyces sp. NBC_00390 TaxID=2975736 RepID=UPI002E20030D